MSDRKYRQRGYNDSDSREERRPRRPQGPKPERDGPWGRGLGAPKASVFRCAVCGEKQPPPEPEDFAAACRKCKADLHTCTHCRHFDTSAPKECRKDIPVRIARKAQANECELFTPKATAEFASEAKRGDDARSAFDALFDL